MTPWQQFYHTIRDPGWPDCDLEKDFDQLPDLVRQMISKTPQMPLMLQENFTVKLLEMLRTG